MTLFAVLVAAPTALLTWMLTRGATGSRVTPECLDAPANATGVAGYAREDGAPASLDAGADAPRGGGSSRTHPEPERAGGAAPGAAALVPPASAPPVAPEPPAAPAPAEREAPRAAGLEARLTAALHARLGPATPAGPPAFYDAQGLFEYIDGAAPLYIDRGFVKLAAVEMTLGGGGELTCDVYLMSSPSSAAAVFDAEGSGKSRSVAVGERGRVSSMALAFVRGAYYVKLTAFSAASEAALPEVARALAARLR